MNKTKRKIEEKTENNINGKLNIEKEIDKLKKVNISLDEEIHLQLKLISVLKGITMNEYIQNAIKKELGKDSEIINKIPRVKKSE